MLSGYYTAASGIMARQREMDVIGNNLVNVRTPGYKGDRLVISPFERTLLMREEAFNKGVLGNGNMATTAVVGQVLPTTNSGVLSETGRTLDLAINGEGYYRILSANGEEFLTRNGQFNVDADGDLALPNYGKVLDDGGATINLEEDINFVDEDGTIYGMEDSELGKIGILVPSTLDGVTKLQNGMYTLSEGATEADSEGKYTILSGVLELSNIDMNQELTNLMEAQRAFQACSSALQIVDGINRKAATQIGNV